ncbi:MAG TPA: S1 family peptidase [Streptomyces sp.]|nr:S1 family peptidase [Streptomyces sp.]
MRRRRGLIVGSAMAVSALALTALPSVAGAVTPSPADTLTAEARQAAEEMPAGALKAMQRDFGISAAEAKQRVANEYRAGQIAPAIAKDLAGSYAGSWVTGSTSTLVVATTDRAEADAITAAGATAKVVEHSMKELDAAKAALDRASKANDTKAAPVWYVDVRSNSVVVRASDTAEARSLVEASGIDSSLVKVVKSAEKPQTYYNLRGGEAYYINNSGRCSIGFSITRGTQRGFVTAGHCGRAGNSTTGYNQVSQGTFQASSFPGNDYAWVATNTNWTTTPYVKGSGGGNVTVSGSSQAAVGSSVCRSGSTTGWRCGSIQQHNTSVTYSQGTVYGVTRTTVCAEPGDSGGSFISGNQAQGMTSGGSGNCTFGGTTYYQPVNPALSAYGLTLVRG